MQASEIILGLNIDMGLVSSLCPLTKPKSRFVFVKNFGDDDHTLEEESVRGEQSVGGPKGPSANC